MASLTKEVLNGLIGNLKQALQEGTVEVSDGRRSMSQESHKAYQLLCDAVLTDDVADDAKALVLIIDQLARQYGDWYEKLVTAPQTVDLTGRQEITTLTEQVFNWKPVVSKQPEALDTLMSLPGMGKKQICLAYAFITDDGEPDYDRLEREIRKPGSEYDPRTFVSLSVKRKLAEIDAEFAIRDWKSRAERKRVEERISSKPQSRIAPEPLDELIENRVPLHQICKMKQMPPDAVLRRANELGVTLDSSRGSLVIESMDPSEYALAQDESVKQRDKLKKETNYHEEAKDYVEQVQLMHLDGLNAQQIYDALKARGGLAGRTKRNIVESIDALKETANA